MADDILELVHGKRSLRDFVDSTPAKKKHESESATTPREQQPEPNDDWILLPSPRDAYLAHSRPANKPIASIHFIMADNSSRGFSYSNLDTIDLLPSRDAGKGPALVLRFAGVIPQEVRLSGRNLHAIRDYLGYHRLAWIRQISKERDFLGDGEEVVTNVEIAVITLE